MIATLAAATIALASFSPRTDTTVTVPAQGRIVIENFAGEVAIATWTRNTVRPALGGFFIKQWGGLGALAT